MPWGDGFAGGAGFSLTNVSVSHLEEERRGVSIICKRVYAKSG
jgi:hypothetical protein